jgi:hypothetical protein
MKNASPWRLTTYLALLLLYTSPAFIASGLIAAYHSSRVLEVVASLSKQMKVPTEQAPTAGAPEARKSPAEPEHDSRARWNEYLTRSWTDIQQQHPSADEKQKLLLFKDTVQADIAQRLHTHVLWNSLTLTLLTLLPLGLLGFGLARRHARHRLAEVKRLALEDWPTKFLVCLCSAFGWLYVLNPYGQGASTAYGFLKYEDVLSGDTLPIYFDANTPALPLLAGFLGWYLHLVAYFSYRLYRGDVVSTRIYGIVFRRILFVTGMGVGFTIVTEAAEVFAFMFLVGYLPMSAVAMLRQFVASKLPLFSAEDQPELTVLPGMTSWDALRLEEEGIHTVPALLSLSKERQQALPLHPGLLELWQGAAALCSVVGYEKYKKLKDHCVTAQEFIHRAGQPEFRATLGTSGLDVHNPDEVVRMLRLVAPELAVESPAESLPPAQPRPVADSVARAA